MLRQGFDERDSSDQTSSWQRPEMIAFRARRKVAATEQLALFANGKDGIAREFQAVVRSENIRRLQVAVDEALAVKVDEDVEGGVENIAHFIRREGALRQDFAEVFSANSMTT